MDLSRLTKRDIKVWEYITKTRYVTTSQLAKMFFERNVDGEINKYALDICRRRLRVIEKSVPVKYFYRGANDEKVYCAHHKKEIMVTPSSLDHSIALNDIISLVISKVQDFYIEPVLLNGLMPDIIIIFEDRICFIEYDTGSETLTKIRKKLNKYKDYFSKQTYLREDWQPASIKPEIVYISKSSARRQSIAAIANIKVVGDIRHI